MWKLRVRSTGKRQKPVYFDDDHLPMHVKQHFAEFLGAMTGKEYSWWRDFSFTYRRGVIKHSKVGYVQIKNVKTPAAPSAMSRVYATLLAYFMPEIIRHLYRSPLNGACEDFRFDYQILIDERKGEFTLVEPNCATFMTIEEGIEYVYKRWAQDPDYFAKFHKLRATVPIEGIGQVTRNGRFYSKEVFKKAMESG